MNIAQFIKYSCVLNYQNYNILQSRQISKMSKKIDKQSLLQQIQNVQNLTKDLLYYQNMKQTYTQKQLQQLKQIQNKIKELEKQVSIENQQKILKLEIQLQEKQKQIEANNIKKQKQTHIKFIDYLNKIIDNLQIFHTPYLVFLVAVDILGKIKQAINVQNQHKNQTKQQLNLQNNLIKKIIRISNNMSPNFLQTFGKNYPYHSKFQPYNNYKQQDKKLQQKLQIYQQFNKILNMIIQTVSEGKKGSNSINYVYKAITDYQKCNDNIYQQSALNWFTSQLNKIRKDKQFICCKTCFISQQLFQSTNRKYFDYKPFTKIQDNPKILEQQEQLSKSIASLMNFKGGVIFLGITNIQDKGCCKVTGFQLEDKNKRQLAKFVIKATNQVYPKHKGFQIQSQKIQIYSTYQINYYITIQFINVIRRSTFQSYCDPSRPYQKLYICKIIVKMGHPRYLYYVLKNQGNKQNKQQAQIHFYIRKEQGNEKQTLQKHYDLIYKKLIDYQEIKKEEKKQQKQEKKYQRPLFHDGCRYDMSISRDKLILENSRDKDDDDEDD